MLNSFLSFKSVSILYIYRSGKGPDPSGSGSATLILRQFAKYQTKKILSKGQMIADTDHTFIMSLTGGGFNLGKQNIYTVFNKYSIYVQYLINTGYMYSI